MRVDFYQLSRDSAEAAIALLAGKTLQSGKRMLVVAKGERLESLSRALWEGSPESFLANGIAGTGHEGRQPILLSEQVEPVNRAQFLLIADGVWRDPGQDFERALYLFDDATIDQARGAWRELGNQADVQRRFWKQDESGRWVEGP